MNHRLVIRKYGITVLLNCVAIALILFGLYASLVLRHTPEATVSAQPSSVKVEEKPSTKPGQEYISGKPARVIIPGANIELGVTDGYYDPAAQTWTLSKDKAHFAAITVPANNQSGNTFIYGHNDKKVLGPITAIQPGDYAIIETDNGKRFWYVMRDTKEVKPTNTEIFQYSGKPILTVQTCSGNWDEKRQLFTFDFVKVEAIV